MEDSLDAEQPFPSLRLEALRMALELGLETGATGAEVLKTAKKFEAYLRNG